MRANRKRVNVNVDVEVDLYPFLQRYKDGHVERLLYSPFVAASEDPASNRGVATRDVIIDAGTGVSARLFLPCRAAAATPGGRRKKKLPLVVYIHGGCFCIESAFCRTYHLYATSLAASAGAVVVSVEYRLAPEHPIPTAYDDAWAALRWAAAASLADDPWLTEHADPRRMFLAGDSAGGNIVYHTAVRAGNGGVDIEGAIMVQPFFWGTERLPSEMGPAPDDDGTAVLLPAHAVDRLWPFVTAGKAGNEDPRLNPSDEEIESLTCRCRRVLVAVAGKDTLRDRGVQLFGRIRDYYTSAGGAAAGPRRAVLVESEGEDHGFHLYFPLRPTSRKLMESIVRFINNQSSPAPAPELEVPLGVPTRPYCDIFDYGIDMKRGRFTTAATACKGPAKFGRGNKLLLSAASANKVNYGLFVTGPVRRNKVYMEGTAVAVTLAAGTRVAIINNFF